jgi:hypothetical protein
MNGRVFDMTTLTATVRDRGEGERRWFSGGGLQTWLATSAETGGAFLLIEFTGEQGKVTPVHIHPASDEAFYRLASERAPEGSLPIPVDFDRIREAAEKTGAIQIVGPPPF